MVSYNDLAVGRAIKALSLNRILRLAANNFAVAYLEWAVKLVTDDN